jgi:hypothetical protein
MASVLSQPRGDAGENRCQNFPTRKQAPASILQVIFLEENLMHTEHKQVRELKEAMELKVSISCSP